MQAAIIPDMIAGRRILALAVTEPSGGSDVAALRTAARESNGDFILNGEKTFITSGMQANEIVVAVCGLAVS